jgi:hypothetical protein
MRARYISVLSIFLIGLFLSDPALAQRNKYGKAKFRSRKISKSTTGRAGKFRPYDYLGYGINALNYYGDLAPLSRAASTDVSFTRPGTGITYGKRFHPISALRINYNYGRIKGDDISSQDDARYARNLSFRNNIHEFNIGLNFYFLPDNNGATYRNPFNVYLFVGGGFFIHDPKGKVPQYDYQQYGSGAGTTVDAPELERAGEWVKLRELRTEGQGGDFEGAPAIYKPFQWNIPVNLGAMLSIPRTPFNIHLELGYRFLFTDYLDDVSNKYVNLDRFDSDLARIMSDRSVEPTNGFGTVNRDIDAININTSNFNGQNYYRAIDIGSGLDGSIRGNPDDNDVYFVTQIKITYIIPPTGISRNRRGRSAAKFR